MPIPKFSIFFGVLIALVWLATANFISPLAIGSYLIGYGFGILSDFWKKQGIRAKGLKALEEIRDRTYSLENLNDFRAAAWTESLSASEIAQGMDALAALAQMPNSERGLTGEHSLANTPQQTEATTLTVTATDCQYYSNTWSLKCAVHPFGPCEGCVDYQLITAKPEEYRF